MKDIEVISLTKSSLKKVISENKFWGNTYQPPFSENKAKWIIENERADDNDIIAVLGYEKYTIIAFVYLVPDLIKVDGNIKKVFWSQRWWVDDKYKETVLSTYVKSLSINACKNQVIIKYLGDNTKVYYKKQPFYEFSKRKRYIIVFSLNYNLLIFKKPILKKIRALLKLTDSVSRKIIASFNIIKTNIQNKALSYKRVESIDDAIWKFVDKHCSGDIVLKSKAYINWQISNNQYHLITDNKSKPNYKCLLGSISEKIYNSNFVIKQNNEIVGFVSVFISGSRLMVRYFITTDKYYEDCMNILIKVLINSKCTLLQTEDSKLGNRIKNKYYRVYKDAKELVSLIHNDVNVDVKDALIADQDGNFS